MVWRFHSLALLTNCECVSLILVVMVVFKVSDGRCKNQSGGREVG